MLCLGHDGIAHLELALTDDAAGNWNTFFSWMMGDVVGTFVLISSAVVLIPATWIFMTLFTEVSISSTSKLGQIAAEVAFKLDVAQAVLLTHEVLANAHILQPAALAHELFLIHSLLIFLLILSELLVLAVDIAAEKRIMTARAFIKLTGVQSILERLVVESICWVFQSLAVKLAVLLQLL